MKWTFWEEEEEKKMSADSKKTQRKYFKKIANSKLEKITETENFYNLATCCYRVH